MLFSAIISFLGGSAFRMIWGEVSHWFTERQNHQQELDRMRLQGELDEAQHKRSMEAITVQAQLGVKTIQVQAEAAINQVEADAWGKVVDSTTRLTGIAFIDIWNGIIRPLLATLAIIMVVAGVIQRGFALSDWDRELIALILGIYLADRQLSKRGK